MNKQVVIMSLDNDISTNKVISFLKCKFVRVSPLTTLNRLKQIFKSSYNCWYRRGSIKKHIKVDNSFKHEWESVRAFLHYKLEENAQFCLGGYFEEKYNNKLINLTNAHNCGLKVPEWDIVSTQKEFQDCLKTFDKIVIKPSWNVSAFIIDDLRFNTKNTVLSNTDDFSLTNLFLPSFVQKYIEKNFEVRTFFLKKELYSMAIFSQLDEKTKFDYRNYNREKPNRCVPYKLPVEIKKKIISLIEKLNLSSGSIDIIVGTNNEYYFLEVNPIGQFDWLSKNCNYYIEKEIAKMLMYEKK